MPCGAPLTLLLHHTTPDQTHDVIQTPPPICGAGVGCMPALSVRQVGGRATCTMPVCLTCAYSEVGGVHMNNCRPKPILSTGVLCCTVCILIIGHTPWHNHTTRAHQHSFIRFMTRLHMQQPHAALMNAATLVACRNAGACHAAMLT